MIGKRLKKSVIVSAFVVGVIYFLTLSKFPGGYVYLDQSSYIVTIEHDGKTVIAPVILDFDIEGQFIVGLKFPIDYRNCKGEKEGRIVTWSTNDIVNLPEYFIIASDTHAVSRFKTQENFEIMLSQLGILESIELDYEVFQRYWERIPRSAMMDKFADEACPKVQEGEHGYSYSIVADIDSGFRSLEEVPFLNRPTVK